MDPNSTVLAVGAIFFGVLVSLIAYNVIGRNFENQAYHSWLKSRRTYFKVLGPVLTILGIIFIVSSRFLKL